MLHLQGTKLLIENMCNAITSSIKRFWKYMSTPRVFSSGEMDFSKPQSGKEYEDWWDKQW